MMDFNINIEFPTIREMDCQKAKDQLMVSSCAVYMFEGNRIWSAFDEMCYNYLNNNDFGYGAVDFEVGFSGYTGKPYPKVFIKCFALRTDTNLNIKPMKTTNFPSESKVNHRGETVIGMRYHFRSAREADELMKCNRLMFEAYCALENPKKTYAFMCQMRKTEDGWKAEYANTYQNTGNDSIKNMID